MIDAATRNTSVVEYMLVQQYLLWSVTIYSSNTGRRRGWARERERAWKQRNGRWTDSWKMQWLRVLEPGLLGSGRVVLGSRPPAWTAGAHIGLPSVGEGTPHGQSKPVRSVFNGASILHPTLLVLSVCEESSKASPGKRRRVGGRCM